MSIETDFRALLSGFAPLTALVSGRIALNAVPDVAGMPCIVFGSTHERSLGLDGTLLGDKCSLPVQCWAETAAQADAVADQVIAAVATAPAQAGAVVIDRSSVYDDELGLDGTLITVEWWT